MSNKALTNDKRLANLIYKSVLKSANKKYPANVRLDVMLEFIDSLKLTLEGLIEKHSKEDNLEGIVSVSSVDVTKLDEPAQAVVAEEKERDREEKEAQLDETEQVPDELIVQIGANEKKGTKSKKVKSKGKKKAKKTSKK